MNEQLMNHILPPEREGDNKPPLYLYAIINAEIYKNLWIKLQSEWKFKHASLFEDEDLAVSMNAVAPYLVFVPPHHPNILKIFKHYGHGGILFFWSEEGFGKVLHRMQNLFEIRSHEGDKGYLAFYRPEMWNTLVQSSSPIRYRFFENSPVFFCEDDLNSNVLYKYSMTEYQVIREKIILIVEE